MAEIGNETSSQVSAKNSSDEIHYGSRSERKKAERPSFAKSARAAFTSARASRIATVTSDIAVSVPAVAGTASASTMASSRAHRIMIRRRISGVVVMTVAMGTIGTFALPAYAWNPADGAVDQTKFVIPDSGQTVSVAAGSLGATARDGFTTTSAAPVAQAASNTTSGIAGVSRGASADVSGIASNSALLNAALSLIGMPGDCTMLIESSLRLLGYQVGDLGPMGFGGYGTVFTDASQLKPGDIMMRGGHVAIYAAPGLVAEGGIGYMSYLSSVASNPAEYVEFVRVG